MGVAFSLFLLAGCGGGDSTATPITVLKQVDWMFDNVSPDLVPSGDTCILNLRVYYDESIPKDQIDGFVITAPTGGYWTVTTPNLSFNTSSNGSPYIIANLLFENREMIPLAGTWTFHLNLKNVPTSSFTMSLHEPGSTASASSSYVYTKDDWSPVFPAGYVAALARYPSQGYQVQFFPDNGGEISSTGMSAVRAAYLWSEPRRYNSYIWLFDANKNYLGMTIYEYSTSDHASTGLITSAGELSIVPAAINASAGPVNLADVKYLRFVMTDGAQYAPNFGYNYRSVSSLVPVN